MTSSRFDIPTIVRWVAGIVALVGGFVALDRWTAPVAMWLATASVLVGIWALGFPVAALTRRVIARLPIPDSAASFAAFAWPYLAATGVVIWATWPVALGDVPFTQDHAHHYLQTSILVDDLIPSGHIFGWTERVGGGLPFGDVYGTGAYFATGLLRIVTFGSVSLPTSYSFGIILVWAIPAWALVAWTRRLLDGMVARRLIVDLAAVSAAAFFVLDIGGDREGGWVYSMFHAVWPQVLGTGMWLFGILTLIRLIERPTVRRLAVTTLVTGFAFWAHPMNVLNFLIAAPLLFTVAAFASRDSQGVEEEDVWWLVPGFALAGLVGFAWVSHMLSAGDDLMSYTAYGRQMQSYAELLLGEGILFDNGLAIVGIAALGGAIVVARKGGVTRLFAVAGLMTFVVLSSIDLFASTDLGLADDAPFVMFKRFVITAKPLLYTLAGAGIGLVAGLAADARRKPPSPLVTIMIIVIASPAIWATSRALPTLVRTPDSRILTVADARLGKQLAEVTKLLIREQGTTPGPNRVVLHYERGDHGDYELFTVAEAGMGYLPNRNPPAHAYDDLNVTNDLELAIRLGGSHIITRGDRDFPGTIELGEFPPFRLLRLKEKPRTPVWAPGSTARLTVEEWEPMRYEVSLKGTKKEDSLVFGIPPYHKWKFTQDGKVLQTKPYRSGAVVLTEVLGVQDGTVVAEFNDTTLERVAFVVFLIVLFLALAGLILGGGRELPRPPKWIGRRAAPVAAIAMTAIAVAIAIWAQTSGAEGIEERWTKGDDERVLDVLHRTRPSFDYRPRPYCVRSMSRNPRTDCDDSMLVPRLVLRRPERKKIPACLNFTVPDNGYIELTFDVPPDVDRLRGELDGPYRSVKKFIKAGEEDVALKSDTIDLPIDRARGVTLRFENGSMRSKELCLELVAIGSK